jgi:hypothetical protein
MEQQPQFGDTQKEKQPMLGIEETNMLQMMLMEAAHVEPSEWIEQNAATFRDVITEDPGRFAGLYQKDPVECAEALKKEIDARVLH